MPTSVTNLASQVSTVAQSDESVMSIVVDAKSPSDAANIANAITAQLRSAVTQLSPESTGVAPVRITQIQAATIPTSPSSPQSSRYLTSGVIAGLLAGLLLVVTLERLNTRIRSVKDITHGGDIPLVGSIPYDSNSAAHPIASTSAASGKRAEAYRALRTNIQFLVRTNEKIVLVVTSSVPGEGKTTSALNISMALADAGHPTVIIDADLRRPRVASYLGIDGVIGLTDVLIGNYSTEDALQSWGDNSLKVLPAGQVPPNPSELLQSKEMDALLEHLMHTFTHIVIDTPPVLPVTDAAVLARRSTGALIVCSTAGTRRSQLQIAIQRVVQAGGRPLGAIATMVKDDRSFNGRYLDYYGYSDVASSETRPANDFG